MIRPVLYFDLAKIIGVSLDDIETQKALASGWGDAWKGEPVKIGKLEVGQVIDYSIDVRDGHVHCGLVIEWSNQLESVADYQGGGNG